MTFIKSTQWKRYFIPALIAIPIAYGIGVNIVAFTIIEPQSSEQVVRYYGPAF